MPGRASRGRTRRNACVDVVLAEAKSTTSVSVKNTENRLPARVEAMRDAGTSRGVFDHVAATAARTQRRPGRRPPSCSASAAQGPRQPRPGSPTASPLGRPDPAGASCDITSARPPKAAAGRPPLITLPKVNRSGVTPSRPHQPAGPTRKPVSTSSRISSAPWRRGQVAQQRVEPVARRDHAHVRGGRFDDDAGDLVAVLREGRLTAATSLYGSTIVSAALAPVTPGVSGRPNVTTPLPALASNASTWPW